MDDVREATDDLLADRPDIESALEEILDIDENGPWTYDDVSIDSGTFGEIVSRNIVEKKGDSYRVADRSAVQAALNDETIESESDTSSFDLSSIRLPEIGKRNALIVASALAFVALVRIVFMWSSVFRGSDIVLAGNDPYFYRYWVDTLLASDLQAFDIGSLTQLPDGVANDDVLLIVSLWWVGSLLGSGQIASGLVVAWYPVIVATVTSAIVYLLATRLTRDRRIGIASVLILAVTPAHAYRTALGFGDHHAFDFLVLAFVVFTMTELVRIGDSQPSHRWAQPLTALGLGLGLTAQAAAWRGGPILLLPIAICVPALAIGAVRADRSPAEVTIWLLGSIAIGSLLTYSLHALLGWMGLYRGITPLLLLIGAVGSVGSAELWHRRGRSARELTAVTTAAVLGGTISVWYLLPELRPAVLTFRQFLSQSGTVAETSSIFSGQLGSIIGPVFVYGFFFFLALPHLAWFSWRAVQEYQPQWLVTCIFALSISVLTINQIRFAGEGSVFISIFAGMGLVHIAGTIESARPIDFSDRASVSVQIPEKKTVSILVALFLLVASMGLVQTPVKMSQITTGEDTYETAVWIDQYATEKGIEYPENYVLTEWDKSRIYNYFVNGESRSYSFSTVYYSELIQSENPDAWVEQSTIDGSGQELFMVRGFVVTENTSRFAQEPGFQILHNRHGSRQGDSPGTQYFRAVYISKDSSIKVFEVVPGTRIVGQAEPESSINISTSVSIEGREFAYNRTVSAGPSGGFSVIVPYTGQYRVGNQSLNVTEKMVVNGRTKSLNKTVGT
ncbi:STT3 domain-containing protein [Haloarcula laminariae]|uniref:STT3 domain-containing protein n=1 Tax=Haloarcula laminariae TaxID=2961577 RepID=UPI0021C802ED|nr:STT3 domain-containing protein [Halomicroarcula laminariae]